MVAHDMIIVLGRVMEQAQDRPSRHPTDISQFVLGNIVNITEAHLICTRQRILLLLQRPE